MEAVCDETFVLLGDVEDNDTIKNEIFKYWERYTYNMYLNAPTSLFERLFYDLIAPYLYSNEDISDRFIDVIMENNIHTLIFQMMIGFQNLVQIIFMVKYRKDHKVR